MNPTAFANMDEALRAIDGLGELASHEVQIKALTAAGAPIAEDIRQRLEEHRFTGATEADISIRESKEAARQGESVVLIGAKRQAYKLRFLEFGTVNQRATPVIRPAWDAGRSGFAARAVASLQASYRSIVGKYARRAA